MQLSEILSQNNKQNENLNNIVEENFKVELDNLTTAVLAKQENSEKEIIQDDDVVKAFVILNCIEYNFISDVFLGVASLNLLNTYSKQQKSNINESFKRHVHNIIKGIEDVHSNNIIVSTFIDNNRQYLAINFWNFQFSFANIDIGEQIKNLAKNIDIAWDGIRKQKCAKTIFDFAYNSKNRSLESMNGQNLDELICKNIKEYKEGKIQFEGGRLYKVAKKVEDREEKKPLSDEEKRMKNYYRAELLSCQDRPVILKGKLKQIHEKHITFKTIRPYIESVKTYTICSHINVYRKDVESVLDISSLEEGKCYFIVAYCKHYDSNIERMGIKLATDLGFVPIIRTTEKIPKEILRVCHRFSIEKFGKEKAKILL